MYKKESQILQNLAFYILVSLLHQRGHMARAPKRLGNPGISSDTQPEYNPPDLLAPAIAVPWGLPSVNPLFLTLGYLIE